MKKALAIGLFLVIGFRLAFILVANPPLQVKVNSANHGLTENERLASFCKVWGFLKYYHPAVASGKNDWDKALFEQLPNVISSKDKNELSRSYMTWVNSLGKIKPHKKADFTDSVKFNKALTWTQDQTLFSEELISQLDYIRKNRNENPNHYVKYNTPVFNTNYENEKTYPDSIFPGKAMRLLSLFRYWNIINYYFPYKYLITENWDTVLVRMIPKFQDAKDATEYHLAILELVASVDDSHAGIATAATNKYFGFRMVPFTVKIIDNKAVVVDLVNDSLASIDDIQIGDVIEKISGLSVSEMIKERSKYFGASNEPTRLRILSRRLLNGNSDIVNIQFERNNIVETKIIHRYLAKTVSGNKTENSEAKHWKMLENNIGYVDMGQLIPEEVDKAMGELMSASAIIFDIRNYPKGTMYKISGYLNKERKEFAKALIPDLTFPGTFGYNNTLSCGKTNVDYYKGKVILLVNETTQSHAEFTCMALQTAPDVKVIGSQTAGADGNVSEIIFPGEFKTKMTGIGIYYPDGRETQRIGIVPDIEVKPTIEGIRQGKDEVMERALLYIKTGK